MVGCYPNGSLGRTLALVENHPALSESSDDGGRAGVFEQQTAFSEHVLGGVFDSRPFHICLPRNRVYHCKTDGTALVSHCEMEGTDVSFLYVECECHTGICASRGRDARGCS